MGGRIIFSEIGFDFDDAGGEAEWVPTEQEFAEKIAGDVAGIAGEEGTWERAGAKARIFFGRFTRC